MFRDLFNKVQKAASDDMNLTGLRALIIAWALFVIVLTLTIKNKLVLAGILAYEVLP